jgi:hypothetical protein
LKNVHQPNQPPPIVKRQAEVIWGREVRNATWDNIKFGPEYLKRSGERSFVLKRLYFDKNSLK